MSQKRLRKELELAARKELEVISFEVPSLVMVVTACCALWGEMLRGAVMLVLRLMFPVK